VKSEKKPGFWEINFTPVWMEKETRFLKSPKETGFLGDKFYTRLDGKRNPVSWRLSKSLLYQIDSNSKEKPFKTGSQLTVFGLSKHSTSC
jgi:hypothetical protein